MTEWHENLRYEYDLTPDSVVLDCGGYEGSFAAEIFARYGCRVIVLEPVQEFYEKIVARFKENLKVEVLPFGIGPQTRKVKFIIKGDMSGPLADSGEERNVKILSMAALTGILGLASYDLIKINIEFGEYPLLEDMLKKAYITMFKNLQIQFHGKGHPDFEKSRHAIRERLAETHEEQWCFPWCWESWRIKA
jgi:FkbM family methyltransferase